MAEPGQTNGADTNVANSIYRIRDDVHNLRDELSASIAGLTQSIDLLTSQIGLFTQLHNKAVPVRVFLVVLLIVSGMFLGKEALNIVKFQIGM